MSHGVTNDVILVKPVLRCVKYSHIAGRERGYSYVTARVRGRNWSAKLSGAGYCRALGITFNGVVHLLENKTKEQSMRVKPCVRKCAKSVSVQCKSN